MKFIIDYLEEILALLGFVFAIIVCFLINDVIGLTSLSVSCFVLGVLVKRYKQIIANNQDEGG